MSGLKRRAITYPVTVVTIMAVKAATGSWGIAFLAAVIALEGLNLTLDRRRSRR